MDVISHVAAVVARGEAVKANGPIEHWLTTLATGFWGFDDSKEDMWSQLQKGDVLVFQAGPPNWDFVEKYKPKPQVSGFIGAGIVERTSKKNEPRWLSEVIESQVHGNPTPKLWPNLVHFSDVVWFGNVESIPAAAVQELIEGCKSNTLDMRVHIERLAQNNLTVKALKNAEFTYAPMGTGTRLVKRSENLASVFLSLAPAATHRVYSGGIAAIPADSQMPEVLDASDYKCRGIVAPTLRSASTSPKVPQKGGVKNRDYLQEAANNQQLGGVGERIVWAKERQRVLDELGEEYVSKVIHVSLKEGDGAGYDIRTLKQGPEGITEHYLEVKTTSGDANTAFFISENERKCAAAELDRYEVVRLHSLDQVKGEYLEYRLTARELLGMNMTAVSYRVNVGTELAQ
ncbi:protein NO VEIN domain-containing protein [Pseudomonas fluorescens]|uniref:Protein NO VEIN C-terminal domain-containing protein n=1 Tax=Pseudomonas fluorescens TaxID=294 RepID=A0A0F4TPP1_PSEFL|nr:DUF3883 domain-containing protein [Pseudomonas fluorescens]KJZ46014.1 hypothetical protein VC34_08210 [Pseudomonas fluorescens]